MNLRCDNYSWSKLRYVAELRLSRLCDRRTIVVASGRLTTSGLDIAGVGVDIWAAGTKSDSPAGPGRPVEPGNSIMSNVTVFSYATELESDRKWPRHVERNNFRTPIFHGTTPNTTRNKVARLSAKEKLCN